MWRVASMGGCTQQFAAPVQASIVCGPSGLRAIHLLRDAVLACQEAGTAPAGDPGALVLAAWSAVHGFATLWADGALLFEGMQPERMAPELGRLIARMFAAVARVTA
jgi:hypothetical protein